MKNILENFFYFALFILLLTASLLGVIVPDNTPVRSVGNMQIANFKNGLSLFQGNRQYYYTFSPFNDYFVSTDGSRNTLISGNEAQENLYKSTFHASGIKDIANSILSYFNATSPSIKFVTDKEAAYSSKVDGNTVTISRDFKLGRGISVQTLGSTMPYYGMDFIYDKDGNLYTLQSEEDISSFEKLYRIKLAKKTEEFRIGIPGKSLAIVNPYVAAVMVLKANDNQTIWVNRNAKMIEVEEQVTPMLNDYSTSLKIEIYSNTQEAQKYL